MRRNDARPQGRPNWLYWVAMAALAVMVALNFPFWLDGSVEPAFFGLPIVFTYHLGFALLAAAVLWLLFTAIWPPGDEESDAGQGGRPR